MPFEELSRAVDAVAIPDGTPCVLEAGTKFKVSQTRGGVTIELPVGAKFRLSWQEADAVGLEVPPGQEPDDPDASRAPDDIKKRIWDRLRRVHDPEIPLDIVELGLVYDVRLTPHEQDGVPAFDVHVVMTLTAPGCGMGDVLMADVKEQAQGVTGVADVTTELSFNPVWNPHTMLSDAAKLQLGLL